MPLDAATIEKAKAWLEQKCPDMACPLCGNKEWNVGDFGVLVPLVEGRASFTAPAIPFLPVVCTNCAQAHFFTATMMGLVPQGTVSDDS